MEIIDSLAGIGFDWRVALANFVNFVIIYFLLNKFIFSKLKTTIDKRTEKIQEGLQRAEDANILKQKAITEREEILRSARHQADEIIVGAKNKEDELLDEARQKANSVADQIVEEAKKKTTNEKIEMEKAFHAQAAALVVQATEKLIQSELDQDQSEKLASQYLNEVSLTSK